MKYLDFCEMTKDGKKTKIFLVADKQYHMHLGSVRWFPRWRRYCFFPASYTVYDANCLAEVQQVIVSEMTKRKKAKLDDPIRTAK